MEVKKSVKEKKKKEKKKKSSHVQFLDPSLYKFSLSRFQTEIFEKVYKYIHYHIIILIINIIIIIISSLITIYLFFIIFNIVL